MLREIKTVVLFAVVGLIALSLAGLAPASPQSQTPSSKAGPLFETVSALDTSLFDAYNKCDLKKIDSFFTEDVEFYHEKNGRVVTRVSVMDAISKNLCGNQNNKVRRELVEGTLRVYQLKNYGALETGEHRFYLSQNGEKERLDGIGQFANVWQFKDGQWKISRVLSYGFRSQ